MDQNLLTRFPIQDVGFWNHESELFRNRISWLGIRFRFEAIHLDHYIWESVGQCRHCEFFLSPRIW